MSLAGGKNVISGKKKTQTNLRAVKKTKNKTKQNPLLKIQWLNAPFQFAVGAYVKSNHEVILCQCTVI